MRLKVTGTGEAKAQLAKIEEKCKDMARWHAFVGSRQPYAYGQEFGAHRVSGRLARRAGGAFYLRRAVDTVMGSADHDITEGMSRVRYPGVWVLRRLALWARRIARLNAPRERGRLRRSILTLVERR